MKRLLAGLLIALFATSAHAANLTYGTSKLTGEKFIFLQGNIVTGDAQRLQMMWMWNPSVKTVYFNSPGGMANEGYNIGNVIKMLGMKTKVNYGNACLSACYTAFIAGKDPEIKGVVGAHVAWMPMDEVPEGKVLSDYLKYGQQLGTFDVIYHLDKGYNVVLPQYTSNVSSKLKFVIFTHEDQLLKFKTDNNAKPDRKLLKGMRVVETKDLMRYAKERLDKDYPDFFDPREEEWVRVRP